MLEIFSYLEEYVVFFRVCRVNLLIKDAAKEVYMMHIEIDEKMFNKLTTHGIDKSTLSSGLISTMRQKYSQIYTEHFH